MTTPPHKVGDRCSCCNTALLIKVIGVWVCPFCDQVAEWPIAAHPSIQGLLIQFMPPAAD